MNHHDDRPHWQLAQPSHDFEIVELCLALFAEDPGLFAVTEQMILNTLVAYRQQPVRGRAVVLHALMKAVGYAFLAVFWSNELGGEVCVIDELYVKPEYRSRGHGKKLFEQLQHDREFLPQQFVALDLEVTPKNSRAQKLYSCLGFEAATNTHFRLLL